jgi:hypothetical protein
MALTRNVFGEKRLKAGHFAAQDFAGRKSEDTMFLIAVCARCTCATGLFDA